LGKKGGKVVKKIQEKKKQKLNTFAEEAQSGDRTW